MTDGAVYRSSSCRILLTEIKTAQMANMLKPDQTAGGSGSLMLLGAFTESVGVTLGENVVDRPVSSLRPSPSVKCESSDKFSPDKTETSLDAAWVDETAAAAALLAKAPTTSNKTTRKRR